MQKGWNASVVPLRYLSRYTLSRRVLHQAYLSIQRQAGGLAAFIRDPEHNVGVRFPVQEVIPQGNLVRFITQRGSEFLATYSEQHGTLSLRLPAYPVTLDFTRRTTDTAPGFYPRTPPTSRYTYRPPLAAQDGWATAGLHDVGLDPDRIAALVQHIAASRPQALTDPYIQGLLIARHGKLVLEEYFYGYAPDRPHDMRSASKTLTTTLVGLALDGGASFDLSTPVYALFPQYPPENPDPRKQRMTVAHLLTMTSGLECDDDNAASAGNEDTMQDQATEPDWYRYTLALPLVHEPGEQAVYCSAGINLLGGIIANTTGTWLPDFVHARFAAPLDFGRYYLQLTPPPLTTMYGGGGSYFRPRDFMKLGQLFLAHGWWNGRPVVSAGWVQAALQPHAHLQDHAYGYGWHLGEYVVGGQTYRRAEAGGNGGQFVIIIPALDLVVMFTAANYGQFGTWRKFRDELVPQYIIPAVQ